MSIEDPSASALSQFQFTETRQLRVISIDGEPWFVAVDVCAVLDHSNVSMALKRLDEDEKQVIDSATLNISEGRENQTLSDFGPQTVNIINESGLYSLILTSRKPEAKQFKKWVTAEVLPAIRKTGRYVAGEQQPGTAPELFSHSDMQNLQRLVWIMSNGFRQKAAMTQAVWKSLRAHTGTPSPQRFQVQHIPVIAAEVRRIYHITTALEEMIRSAEAALVKRILIHGENADKILEHVGMELAKADSESRQLLNKHLARWGEQEVMRFVERQPCWGRDYPEAQESLAFH